MSHQSHQGTNLFGKGRFVLCLFFIKPHILQQQNLNKTQSKKSERRVRELLTSPLPIPSTAFLTVSPIQSSTFFTVLPSNSVNLGTTGLSLNLSSGPDLGRPCTTPQPPRAKRVLTKCEVSSTFAPFSTRYLSVGTAALTLVSSVILSSASNGTLRSARTKTCFPFRSVVVRSPTDFFAIARRGVEETKRTPVRLFEG